MSKRGRRRDPYLLHLIPGRKLGGTVDVEAFARFCREDDEHRARIQTIVDGHMPALVESARSGSWKGEDDEP